MLAAEPTESTDAIEPADPMDRIDPAEPMHRIDPAEPMDRIDPLDPMLKMEPSVFRMRSFSQGLSRDQGPTAVHADHDARSRVHETLLVVAAAGPPWFLMVSITSRAACGSRY